MVVLIGQYGYRRSVEASDRTQTGPQSIYSTSIRLKRGAGLGRQEIKAAMLKVSSGKAKLKRNRRGGAVQILPSPQTASPVIMRNFVRKNFGVENCSAKPR